LIPLPANKKIHDKVEDFISQVLDVHRQATQLEGSYCQVQAGGKQEVPSGRV